MVCFPQPWFCQPHPLGVTECDLLISFFFFQFHWHVNDIQHCVKFKVSSIMTRTSIYCEMITRPSLAHIRPLTQTYQKKKKGNSFSPELRIYSLNSFPRYQPIPMLHTMSPVLTYRITPSVDLSGLWISYKLVANSRALIRSKGDFCFVWVRWR